MSEETMERIEERQYTIVGWLAIAGGVLILPAVALGFLLELSHKPFILVFLLPYLVLFTASMGFTLYALYRFRGLLNERYQFHDVDGLITAILILGATMVVVGCGLKVVGTFVKISADSPMAVLPVAALGLGMFVFIGLPLCVVNIMFAVKLLRLQDDLYGLLKPYAYLTIVAAALFATLILGFLGFFVDAACSIVLGLVFLRAARGLPAPEFV